MKKKDRPLTGNEYYKLGEIAAKRGITVPEVIEQQKKWPERFNMQLYQQERPFGLTPVTEQRG